MNSQRQSPLAAIHHAYDAKMTEFAGYSLPLYFKGFKQEHLHTRTKASLFDISHMGQIELKGPDLVMFLEKLVPADLKQLEANRSVITVLLNEQAGVIDDLMVMRQEDSVKVIANGAQKHAVIEILQSQLGDAITINHLDDYAFLALQGPASETVLKSLNAKVSELRFLSSGEFEIDGINCCISRSGYSGEDGFEISIESKFAEQFANVLLKHDLVEPAGLGARDSLRLEAGLCLYGNELNDGITPVEAGLGWMIHKTRRDDDSTFNGKAILLRQLKEGPEKMRVGLSIEGKIPVREGTILLNENNDEIGRVTSGVFSPSLNYPIAHAYVDVRYTKPGTILKAEVRKKAITVTIRALPFIQLNYKK